MFRLISVEEIEEHMNYVEEVTDRIDREVPGLDPELARLYALLVLVKGRNTTLRDVHDVWALWCTPRDLHHRSVIPFDQLSTGVQELDREYMKAIHRVSTNVMTESWSSSRHRAYITCPRQHWLTSVARVPREDSSASVRGQVLHAAVAAGWIVAAEGAGPDEVLDVIVEAAEDEACRQERHGAEVDDDELCSWIELAALTVEHAGPKPGDTLLGVEYEVRGEVDGVSMLARLDLAYQNAEGMLVVRDWKSSSKVPTQDDLLRDVQLGLGALLAARHWNRTRVRVEIGSIGAQVVSGVDMPRERAQGAGERVAASARKAAADTEFTPRRSEACAECKVRRFCPLFAGGPVPEPENLEAE